MKTAMYIHLMIIVGSLILFLHIMPIYNTDRVE